MTYCHIKRHKHGPALCGPQAGCAYVALGRDEQIPQTEFPICPPCATRHIEEHYAALKTNGYPLPPLAHST